MGVQMERDNLRQPKGRSNSVRVYNSPNASKGVKDPQWEFIGHLWSNKDGKFVLERDGRVFELKLKNPEFIKI